MLRRIVVRWNRTQDKYEPLFCYDYDLPLGAVVMGIMEVIEETPNGTILTRDIPEMGIKKGTLVVNWY